MHHSVAFSSGHRRLTVSPGLMKTSCGIKSWLVPLLLLPLQFGRGVTLITGCDVGVLTVDEGEGVADEILQVAMLFTISDPVSVSVSGVSEPLSLPDPELRVHSSFSRMVSPLQA